MTTREEAGKGAIHKIGTKKAKQEFEDMRALKSIHETQILAGNAELQRISSKFNEDWALFNHMLYIVDMKSVKDIQDGMRTVYRHIQPYLARVEEDKKNLKLHFSGVKKLPESMLQEILNRPNP